jgi:hypothetical protein
MRYRFLSSFLFAGALFANPLTAASVTLTELGTPWLHEQVANSSFAIGPYTLNIGGRSLAALSIDFLDGTTLGATWAANITTLNSQDLSTTYHSSESAQYKQAAYLFNQIDTPGLSHGDRIAIQNAAWYIFSPSAVGNVMDAASYHYYSNSVLYADGMLASAFAIVSSVDPANNRGQEFLISSVLPTPEPSNITLVAIGTLLLAFGLLRNSFRRSGNQG